MDACLFIWLREVGSLRCFRISVRVRVQSRCRLLYLEVLAVMVGLLIVDSLGG